MRDDLTALDWIGAVMALIGVVWAALLLPWAFVPHFAAMFRDFGGPLPAATRLVLLRWPLMVGGLAPAGLLAAALTGARPLGRRRALIVAAFVAGGALLAAGLWALYLPIFRIAGSIQ